METIPNPITKSPEELEEWFLSRLESPESSAADLLDVIDTVAVGGPNPKADALADLLFETAVRRGMKAEGLLVLERMLKWRGSDPAFRSVFAQCLASIFRRDPLGRKFADSIGIEKNLPLAECLRRLRFLLALAPGVFCLDRTWGFGVVQRLEEYMGKVVVDFDSKRGHEMAFAYAAEALKVVGPEHILAIKHQSPEKIMAMVQSQPDEIVRMVLRCYGPLPIAMIQDFLAQQVLGATEWKGFWEAARKRLKEDPLVEIPAKRNDPVILRDRAKAFDGEWFAGLRHARLIPDILGSIEELAVEIPALDDEQRAIVADRLKYVVLGAGARQPESMARAAMLATHFGLPADAVDVVAVSARLLQPRVLQAAVQKLPVRYYADLLLWLHARDAHGIRDCLLGMIPDMTMGFLNEALAFLRAQGWETECAARLRELIGKRQPGPAILYWVGKRLELMAEWSLGASADLPMMVVEELRLSHSGELLKASNQVTTLIEQKEWLQVTIGAMGAAQRAEFFQVLQEMAAGRAPFDVRSVLVKLHLLFPELGQVTADAAAVPSPSQGRLTSWRSLKERQALLEKIIDVDIPANSRDIGVARSYGDLRENFEYKAAKDQQGLLLRRRGELEKDLQEVRGTDFSGFPVDPAGPGTTIRLRFPDGHEEQYHILGEWDQDTTRGIIASGSRMAQCVTGHKAGDVVDVPGMEAQSLIACTLESVSGLSDDIRNWASGNR